LAGRGTTVIGQGVAVVAPLTGFDLSVATHGWGAVARTAGALEAGLDLARRGASIAADGISVVAVFVALDDAVTTERCARLAGHPADVAGLDSLAILRAAITADSVSVVAGFVGGQNPISANPEVLAGLPRSRTRPVGLGLAEGIATIIGNSIGTNLLARGHAVIALLARIQNAVAAFLDVDGACVRGTDTTDKSTSAAAGATVWPCPSASTRTTSALALPAWGCVDDLGGAAAREENSRACQDKSATAAQDADADMDGNRAS
jgi:hypothetical protein